MSNTEIDLYYWHTPNGQKIRIMLEECALAYKIHPIDINNDEQFASSFLKISPNNKIPAIVDPQSPDGKPLSVFESGAILQYLARKANKFYGSTESDRTTIDQWLFWQVGGLGPMLGQAHHFRIYAKEEIPYGVKRYTDEAARLYGVMERHLAQNAYLAGESYTIADIASYPWIARHESHGQDLQDSPAIENWFKRISERDSVARAMVKPY